MKLAEILRNSGYLSLLKRLEVVNKELSKEIDKATSNEEVAKKAIRLTVNGLENIVEQLKEINND